MPPAPWRPSSEDVPGGTAVGARRARRRSRASGEGRAGRLGGGRPRRRDHRHRGARRRGDRRGRPGGTHLARKYTWQHVRDHVRLQCTSQDQ